MRLYLGYNIDPKIAVLVDNVQITAMSTMIPSSPPTSSPVSHQPLSTVAPTVISSLTPTLTAISCPNVADISTTLSSNIVMITFADAGVLCILVKVTVDINSGNVTNIIPLARSYDNFMWELTAGEYAASYASDGIFQCYDHGCQFWLPQKMSNEMFQLRSYQYSLPEVDQYARMLERTSFGVTQSNLREVSSLSYDSEDNIDQISYKMAQWIKMQMTMSMTSHREYWRQRANPRVCSTISYIFDFTFTNAITIEITLLS
jgi:hypothetical protein